MNRIYIYKTKDGTSFDLKRDAVCHERKCILREILTGTVASDDIRERMIETILDKFDDICEAFDNADVKDIDDDE